jgi:hypothetical protein
MLPDFLCIGAQKAGTTWLHRNIVQHPDVWMPPVKEIHYFNRPSSWPLIIQMCHPNDSRMRSFALRGLVKRLRRFGRRPVLSHKANGSLRARSPEALKASVLGWYFRFLLLPRNDQWYASLFAPSRGRVTGDITPYYANLEEDRVAYIHSLMPDAKIMYLLRNPIHRLWSHAAMHFSRDGFSGLATVGEEQVREFLERQSKSRISDYAQNLQTWSLYPEEQFFVGFFDHLVQNPRGFLKEIYRYLELDASDQFVPQTVQEKRNPGQYYAIPDHFARFLASQYLGQIEQLHQRFDNRYTAVWLNSVQQYL